MKMWEVQGSYWQAREDMTKGGYRANRRAFVVAASLERAVELWVRDCPGPDHAVHQAICRTTHDTELIIDQGANR